MSTPIHIRNTHGMPIRVGGQRVTDIVDVIVDADNSATRRDLHKFASSLIVTGVAAATPSIVSVIDYGATGNGVTDDTVAIQAAIDGLPSTGGEIYFPPGTYVINGSPLTGLPNGSRVRGAGRLATILKRASGAGMDMWQFDNGAKFMTFQGMKLQTYGSGGHLFAPQGVFTQGNFNDLHLVQNNPNKSVWRQPNAGYYYNSWRDSYCYHEGATSVGAFDFTSATGALCNANVWQSMTIETAAAANHWVFDFATSAAASYIYGNTFRDITSEVNNGGFARILSSNGFIFDHIDIYDLTTTHQHLFYVGAGGGNETSRQNTFRHIRRFGGTLGGGLVDVYLQAGKATNTRFEFCGLSTGGTGFTVECNSNTYTVDIDNHNVTFNNFDNSTGKTF